MPGKTKLLFADLRQQLSASAVNNSSLGWKKFLLQATQTSAFLSFHLECWQKIIGFDRINRSLGKDKFGLH